MIIGRQFDYMRPSIVTTTNTEVKTIDEFVEYIMTSIVHSYLKSNEPNKNSIDETCKFIVNCHPGEILELLNSNDNKPSKYDLKIIGIISKKQKLKKDIAILKAYNDREV